MTDPYVLAALRPLEEFVRDPSLTVACVLLIVVSVAWVVVSRLIYANLRRAAWREQAAARALMSARAPEAEQRPRRAAP
jgi:cell division protein FtsX